MDNQEAALQEEFARSEAVNVQRNADMLAVTFKSDVLFDINSATLKPGAYVEIDRVANVFVITSYSIHYTKLYEIRNISWAL